MKDKLTFEQECSLIANGEDLPKEKQIEFEKRINCGIAYCEDVPNKQIEEMAKDLKELADIIRTILEDRTDIKYIPDLCFPIAKEVLKRYQPKLPEDSVVITKEEYEKTIQDKLKLGIEMGKRQARKEMAEKIYKLVDNNLDLYRNGVIGGTLYDSGYQTAISNIKRKIKDIFGVEIKE